MSSPAFVPGGGAVVCEFFVLRPRDLPRARAADLRAEGHAAAGLPPGLVARSVSLDGEEARAQLDALWQRAPVKDDVWAGIFNGAEALEMLKAERGRAFDPVVVDAFLAHAEDINALRCRITQECPSFDSLIDSP